MVVRSHRRPLGASIVNKPFPKHHGSRWLFGASHDIFAERSYAVTFPYDGTPEGNGLGLLMDDDDRRRRAESVPSFDNAEAVSGASPALQRFNFVLCAAVVLGVMLYGTVG
jgi:hypothetical protein